MNSASDDSALEQAMIGRWVGASRGQTFDYTFHPKHCFTLTIRSAIEPAAKVFGYWDVRENSLHMGISESATDAAPIEISPDSFSIILPGGNRTDFRRQLA
jgi:hypothetical protein